VSKNRIGELSSLSLKPALCLRARHTPETTAAPARRSEAPNAHGDAAASGSFELFGDDAIEDARGVTRAVICLRITNVET